jgi:two-component system, OmpR family, alkaline phosphatase synthesis response regulator PhoP
MARLLIVDDEPNLRHSLSYALRQEGYEVATAEDGETAIELFRQSRPDLVVLDVMLPKMDGLAVCRAIRRESEVPVIMLTARSTELDTIVGLEVGADDYLAKPFSTRELIARVRAALRRAAAARGTAATENVSLDGLRIDVGRHQVSVDGREVELKPREFDLLRFLASHPGQVFARNQLLASVWGLDYSGDSRTVDTHVKTLRERLGDAPEQSRWIETVRGVGYRFREAKA